MIEILMNYISYMHVVPLADVELIPFGEYLGKPWDWFLAQSTVMKAIILIVGPLAFYLFLRLFFKIVESILSIFQ